MGQTEYDVKHQELLEALVMALRPHLIVGTCTDHAWLERNVALRQKTMLMAQVGVPNYYSTNNPYVFGFHVSSDTYLLWAVRELKFYADEPQAKDSIPDITTDNLPVHFIYRSQSEFYKSACLAGADLAEKLGFTVTRVELDPFGDHNNNGIPNEFDADYVNSMVDQACPPGTDKVFDFDANPAVFGCLAVEHDMVLHRLKENGCRPTSVFLTTPTISSWMEGKEKNLQFFLGASQWHEDLDEFGDMYFEDGRSLPSSKYMSPN